MTATLTPEATGTRRGRRRCAAGDRGHVARSSIRRSSRQRRRRASSKLNPRTMVRNPVMFIVEVGSVLTTVLFFRDLGSSDRQRERVRRPGRRVAVVHRAVRQLRRGDGRGPGQGAGGDAAQDPGRDGGAGPPCPTGPIVEKPSTQLAARRPLRRRRRRGDPRRRRRRRGHRHGRRVGHHRRVGPGHPRVAAATARPSPAAPGCCPTRSSCASRPSRARRSSTG